MPYLRRACGALRQPARFFSVDPDPYLKGIPDEFFFEVGDDYSGSEAGAEWDSLMMAMRFMGISLNEWFKTPVRRQRKFYSAFSHHVSKHPLSTL